MKLIQFVLIPALIVLLLLYWKYVRSRTLNRILLLISVLAGIYFVLFPDVTTHLANLVGVGRGTDLVMYVAIVAFSFGYILMYSKLKQQEKTITAIVRDMAIQQARMHGQEDSIQGQNSLTYKDQ